MNARKLFKLFVLKLIITLYMGFMAGVVYLCLTISGVDPFVSGVAGVVVSVALMLGDDREYFSKKIMQFSFTNYLQPQPLSQHQAQQKRDLQG
jgi:hypothetical protein